jgi:hypothetical protein
MSLYLNTLGKSELTIAVCDRCKMKRSITDLISDPNATGLRVCVFGCVDDLDPWRLPPRAADKITVQYPRPDEPLTA